MGALKINLVFEGGEEPEVHVSGGLAAGGDCGGRVDLGECVCAWVCLQNYWCV